MLRVNIQIYRTIILPVVLYGCETWSLTVREDRRLGVFENRVFENRVFEENIWAEEGRCKIGVEKTT
jgi:hypothetical protein